MAETATLKDTFRCPVCLFTMSKTGDWPPDTRLQCAKCEAYFKFKDVLPPVKPSPESDALAGDAAMPEASAVGWDREMSDTGRLMTVGLAGLVLVVACWLTWSLGRNWDGPTFLFAYALLFFFLIIAQWVVRHGLENRMWVSLAAAVILLAVGLTRIITGSLYLGMSKWMFLIMMMLLGGALQFLRFRQSYEMGSGAWFADSHRADKDSGSSWFSSSGCSSCGGGCGGGGCGGGGCGGCGG